MYAEFSFLDLATAGQLMGGLFVPLVVGLPVVFVVIFVATLWKKG